jgi:hypothetical protein
MKILHVIPSVDVSSQNWSVFEVDDVPSISVPFLTYRSYSDGKVLHNLLTPYLSSEHEIAPKVKVPDFAQV